MTAKTDTQLKAEFQGVDPQDFMNNMVDSMKAGVLYSYVYLGTIAGQTTNLGATFLSTTGRAHKAGDMCAYYDSVGVAYRFCIATGTGASNFLEYLAVAS